MKKAFARAVVVIGVVGALIYAQREPLLAAAVDQMTAHMFVGRDTDSFDPGAAAGTAFPAIRALYQGREITGVTDFTGKRGLAIFVNRSVDW